MAASYPAAIKNFTAVVNGVTKLVAALFNSGYDEITAIETELGTDVAGSTADLKTRLAVFLNDDGTPKLLGAWTAKVTDTSYLAATDGFALAYTAGAPGTKDMQGLTDAANPPTTLRTRAYTNDASNTVILNLTLPVRKGDYWKITGANAVIWIPIGS